MRTGPFSPAACASTGVAVGASPNAIKPDATTLIPLSPAGIFSLPGDCSGGRDASTSPPDRTKRGGFYEQVQHRDSRAFEHVGLFRQRLRSEERRVGKECRS